MIKYPTHYGQKEEVELGGFVSDDSWFHLNWCASFAWQRGTVPERYDCWKEFSEMNENMVCGSLEVLSS